MTLYEHLRSLPMHPVLDVLGKWVHVRNARTGTTSMDEGPLRARGIHHRRNSQMWETVWDRIIRPGMGNDLEGACCIEVPEPLLWTFVRNPWDRICSAFFHCRERTKRPENQIDKSWEFAPWVKRVLAPKYPNVNRHFAEQYSTAFFEGKQFGFVGRFENIQADWEKLARHIDASPRIPHLNATLDGSYQDHYDEESRQIIGEIYAREIEAFGYEFGA